MNLDDLNARVQRWTSLSFLLLVGCRFASGGKIVASNAAKEYKEPCPKECVCFEQKYVELGGRVVNCSRIERMSRDGGAMKRVLAELAPSTQELIFTENHLNDTNNFNKSLASTMKRNLRLMDLSTNDITILIPGIFHDFENLNSLYLSRNKLGRVEPFTFASLSRLRVLDLSENRIELLNPGCFEGLTKLTELWLVGNFLKELNPNVLSPLSSSLEHLHLTNNSLTTLDAKILASLNRLQQLWLDGNNISSLNENLYQQFNYKTFRNINFQGNPFRCDCRLLWLRVWYANQVGENLSDDIPTCFQPENLRGKFLNQLPMTDISFLHCDCPYGYYNPDPVSDNNTQCIYCDMMITDSTGTTHKHHDCHCKPGFQSLPDGTCQPCPINTYKPLRGHGHCLPCAGGSSTNTIGASVCYCHKGYYLNHSNNQCTECPVHHYKTYSGPLRDGLYGCFQCPVMAQSSKASTSKDQCVCLEWTSKDAKGDCVTRVRDNRTSGHHFSNFTNGNGRHETGNGILIYVGGFSFAILIFTLILSRYIIKRCRLKRIILEKHELGTVKTFMTSMAVEVDYHEGWEIEASHVNLGKILGTGAFGVVYEAVAVGLQGHAGPTVVAVKTLPENFSAEEVGALQSELKQLLYVGQHSNIISLLGCVTTEGCLMLIMEYARYGDLLTFLKAKKHVAIENDPWLPQDDVGHVCELSQSASTNINCAYDRISISEDTLLSFAWQIAKGMSHLASIKCIHRDLATRNVLLADGFVVKISDFGLARAVYETGYYFKQSKGRLPFKWMAPEAILQGQYTTKSDVWSFGILFWEILTLGGTPYPGVPINSLLDLLLSGYRMSRPQHCRPQFYEIMSKCWQEHPSDRPSFETLKDELEKLLAKISKNEYLNLAEP